MYKSEVHLTFSMRNMKKVMTAIEVKDIDETFIVKLRVLNIEDCFF